MNNQTNKNERKKTNRNVKDINFALRQGNENREILFCSHQISKK